MPPGDQSKPSPISDGWLFEAAIRPSTLDDEYDRPTEGAGPPSEGGMRIGYDQEKLPELPPADQVPEEVRLVAEKSPAGPDAAASSATTVPPDAALTVADAVPAAALLSVASGRGRQPAAVPGRASPQGSSASRSRVAQSPPYAQRNDE